MMEVKIGADPEFFLNCAYTDYPKSAHKIVPGTKDNPYPVKGGAVQHDGVAAEINIDPSSDFETFNANIDSVLDEIECRWLGHWKMDKRTVVKSFTSEFMERLPKEVRELGCEPDFDAYTGSPNPRPVDNGYRSVAGHIHVGWTENETMDDWYFDLCRRVVRELDRNVGVYTSFRWPDQERKNLYGKAGCFRPKPYGLEYRVPNNQWLWSKESRWAIFHLTQQTVLGLINEVPYKTETFFCRVSDQINHKTSDPGNLVSSMARAEELFSRV